MKHNVTVTDVAWKLISKWRRKYEKQFNVLEIQAIIHGIMWLMCQRANSKYRVTDLANLQVLCYMHLRDQSGASGLWRISRRIGALYLAENGLIYQHRVGSEKHLTDAPSRRIYIKGS